MKLRTTLLAAAAALAFAPVANAYEGLYGAIGAGVTSVGDDNDIDTNGTGPHPFDSSADYESGIGVYTALGYDTGNGWRTELELAHRSNDIQDINSAGPTFSGLPEGSIAGDVSSYSLMLNVIRDFAISEAITPFIGAGVGLARVDHDIAGSFTPSAPPSTLSVAYGPVRTQLAYQAIAGLSFGLAEGLALDVSYRYFGVSKPDVVGTVNGAPATFDISSSSHNVFAGLRWNFGAAPAPQIQYKDCWDGSSVPVTAECPPQVVEEQSVDLDPIEFTVYFDYDKANLTPQASTLVQEAASRALANDIDTVVVSGNTDTSGSSAYNQALSERRSRIVRDALVANGVPADRIRTDAYGESNLAKATPDGTREPLNRRSDVVISFE